MQVIGSYHSHPNSPAIPSATDVAQSDDPHFLQVIDDRHVLVSEGWGSGVIVADVLSGSSRRYTGPSDRAVNAPHGICHRSPVQR